LPSDANGRRCSSTPTVPRISTLAMQRKSSSVRRENAGGASGKVHCKVDAQYGLIEVGDLLTTSPMLGHAMRVLDSARAFCSVLG
jgi:hypothetical protein